MLVQHKWLVLGAAVFGLFMAILDSSIVNIAIPTIQRSLDTDIDTVTWVLNAYNLVFAVLLIPVGRLADRFGRKKLFLIGIVIFSLCSLGAGLSQHVGVLIGWRAAQAVGAATMVPVSLAIVTLAFPAHQRGLALGIWGAMSGVAGAIGPTLGGVLTEYVGWEWIFLVNVPIGFVAVLAGLIILDESRDPEARQHMDLPGTALLSVALFSLTFALIRGQEVGWSSTFIIGLFVLAAVAGALFLFVERRVSQPIVDLGMLSDRTFSAASATILLFGLGFFGGLFLIIQYLTVVEGYSALRAAVAITPYPACLLLVGPVAGRLSDRFGSRTLVMAGVLIFGVALFTASRLGGGESYPQIAWRLVVAGIGSGLIFAPLTSAVMGTVRGGRAGVSAGVFNTARQIGFTLGLAILVAVFIGALPSRITSAQQQSVSLVEQSDLPTVVKQGIVEGILNIPVQEAEQAARSGTQPSFDLYDRVKQAAGPQLADSARPTLDELSERIQAVFASSTASAFDRSFLVAAIFVWFAVLPALLVGRAAAIGPGPPSAQPAAPTR